MRTKLKFARSIFTSDLFSATFFQEMHIETKKEQGQLVSTSETVFFFFLNDFISKYK